jgi:hypothetical protein
LRLNLKKGGMTRIKGGDGTGGGGKHPSARPPDPKFFYTLGIEEQTMKTP